MEDQNVSMFGIKNSVSTLTSPEDFERWDREFRNWSLAKGALAAIDNLEEEPFRLANTAKPANTVAAVIPPMGLLIDPDQIDPNLYPGGSPTKSTRLKGEDREIWDRWAKGERIARSALFATVDPTLISAIRNKWSAHDVYKALKTRLCLKRKLCVGISI